jgi:hypothetical protein
MRAAFQLIKKAIWSKVLLWVGLRKKAPGISKEPDVEVVIPSFCSVWTEVGSELL